MTHWELKEAVTRQVRAAEGPLTCSVCNMEQVGGWSFEDGQYYSTGEWMTWHLEQWHPREKGIIFSVLNGEGLRCPINA